MLLYVSRFNNTKTVDLKMTNYTESNSRRPKIGKKEMSTVGPHRQRVSLACTNCRSRRVKCNVNGSLPCLNCEKRKLECVVLAIDKRKDRYRTQYMIDLESRVSEYEDILAKLKEGHDHTSKLLQSAFQGIQQTSTQLTEELTEEPEIPLPTAVRGTYLNDRTFTGDESIPAAVYGPTSVFDTETARAETANAASLSADPIIVECVKMFFLWQYPDIHLFVFREAFLLDFFNPKSNGVYSSVELVKAICAIGSLVSLDPSIREKSDQFYTESREALMNLTDSPTISSLQAYLLLGLYDVYNGRINRGWILSGDAFRMGVGLGFHLSPTAWLVKQEEEVSDFTVSIRSRIFWGSFIADRFLSLILGRSPSLKTDDASIPTSINMPAIEWIEDYSYPGPSDQKKANYIDISNPLKCLSNLVSISDEILSKVFAKQGDEKAKNLSDRINLLGHYNEKIFLWRKNLPGIMQWTTDELAKQGHDHTKMFMRYFYYMVLLCLNRPFIEETNNYNDSRNARKVCEGVIKDIYTAIHSFVGIHGFERCSFLILYSCIMCVSIILLSINASDLTENSDFKDYFFEFMTVLKLSALTWKLCERSYNKVRITLQNEYKLNYDDLFSKFLEKKQTEDERFLVEGNSIISMISTDQQDLYTDYPTTGETNFSNLEELVGFGGPPVFTTSQSNDWSFLFSTYTPADNH